MRALSPISSPASASEKPWSQVKCKSSAGLTLEQLSTSGCSSLSYNSS
jgi:hypothetical protein